MAWYFSWRRERDSNPRGGLLPPIDLANRPLQPLGYLSVVLAVHIVRSVLYCNLKLQMKKVVTLQCHGWRRGWDSNPRYHCWYDGFQDRYLRPLGHLSRRLLNCIRGWDIARLWRAPSCGTHHNHASTIMVPFLVRRTHGTVAGTLVFKTSSLNRSDTSP